MSYKQAGAGLILVLSTERSGSTLLSTMLGAHSRILAPPELHLLRYRGFDEWLRAYPSALRSLQTLLELLGEEAGRDGVRARFRGRPSAEVYRMLLALAPRGCWIVDKTPGNAFRRETLERAERFEPRYVWLVRHPLGMAQSRLERIDAKRRAQRGRSARLKYPIYRVRKAWRRRSGRELRDELERWRDVHGRIERFLEEIPSERSQKVHFETLVRGPEGCLEHLCEWLGLAFERAMLEPRAHVPQGLQWGLGDQKLLSHTGIDASVADRWRSEYDERTIDLQTAALMARIGVGSAPASTKREGEGQE